LQGGCLVVVGVGLALALVFFLLLRYAAGLGAFELEAAADGGAVVVAGHEVAGC